MNSLYFMRPATGEKTMSWTSTGIPQKNIVKAIHLRKFGFAMSAVLGIISVLAWWYDGWIYPWVVFVAAGFLIAGILVPTFLAPVERGWMALAETLSIVVNMVILTLIFYALITLIGLFRRLVSRDSFGLGFDPNQSSYWKPVEMDGPAGRPDKPY